MFTSDPAMISPERLDAMQLSWVRLMGELGVSPASAYPVFDQLVEAYQQPHRYYHTLEHLAEMFRVIGRLAPLCRNPVAVQLAIWFHDVVYDPKVQDNECRSAAKVIEWLQPLGLPPELLDQVAELVNATAHMNGIEPPTDPNVIVLLDADLAILGASEDRYQRYAADIRKEYAHVPNADYRKGRISVLNRFLARPRLYHTAMMYDEGDAAARRNLRAEMEQLQSPN